jgi:hypothetical protein
LRRFALAFFHPKVACTKSSAQTADAICADSAKPGCCPLAAAAVQDFGPDPTLASIDFGPVELVRWPAPERRSYTRSAGHNQPYIPVPNWFDIFFQENRRLLARPNLALTDNQAPVVN